MRTVGGATAPLATDDVFKERFRCAVAAAWRPSTFGEILWRLVEKETDKRGGGMWVRRNWQVWQYWRSASKKRGAGDE